MPPRLTILNGPNLNLLGVREPNIYGSTTLSAIKKSCEQFAKIANARLSFHQSNHEGVLVDLIQAARQEADAIIINPAALSFTSIALFDALKVFEGPIIECHISNIHARYGTALPFEVFRPRLRQSSVALDLMAISSPCSQHFKCLESCRPACRLRSV